MKFSSARWDSVFIPARDPFIVVRKLYFPSAAAPPSLGLRQENILEKTSVDMPAAEVPSAVFTMAEVTLAPSPGFEMLPCLAPLDARKPKTRMNAPRAARGTECPGMLTGLPPESNLPMRGPMRTQPTRAMVAGRRREASYLKVLLHLQNMLNKYTPPHR